MKLITPILAGAAVLALSNVALADEARLTTQQPILLTDTQMDSVTAGSYAYVDASVSGGADAYGGFYLETGRRSASADIWADVYPGRRGGSVYLSAGACAGRFC
jgi:hypothetical protein